MHAALVLCWGVCCLPSCASRPSALDGPVAKPPPFSLLPPLHVLQLANETTLVPAHPALDYWSIVITLVAINCGNDIRRTYAAARLAAALAAPRHLSSTSLNLNATPSSSQEEEGEGEAAGVASLRGHLVTEVGLDPATTEVLLVLLQHCLAAVAPLGGTPPLVNPALAAIDPYQAVVTYLAGRGIPELLPGECFKGLVGSCAAWL